jgi:hypothetical protein
MEPGRELEGSLSSAAEAKKAYRVMSPKPVFQDMEFN